MQTGHDNIIAGEYFLAAFHSSRAAVYCSERWDGAEVCSEVCQALKEAYFGLKLKNILASIAGFDYSNTHSDARHDLPGRNSCKECAALLLLTPASSLKAYFFCDSERVQFLWLQFIISREGTTAHGTNHYVAIENWKMFSKYLEREQNKCKSLYGGGSEIKRVWWSWRPCITLCGSDIMMNVFVMHAYTVQLLILDCEVQL